jgi:hypothetical protein
MRALLHRFLHWRTVTGLVLGGAGGALYSVFVGCKTGCAITSSPVLSALFGAFIGVTLLLPAATRPGRKEQAPEAPPAP